MKQTLLVLHCLVTALSAQAQQPPVSPCITNVYITTWGDLSVPYAYWGSVTNSTPGNCTNANTYTATSDGRILISDCSTTNCWGVPISISANQCGVYACQSQDQVIGVLWWKCDSSTNGCDPDGVWHSRNIVLPAHTFWVQFYVCSSPNCDLTLSCITQSYPCSGPPEQ
jgi:hypothetical protein